MSCSSDNEFRSEEGIIFGEIYGLCSGDCRTLYLLTEKALYEDTDTDTEYGNWENTSFRTSPLAKEKFDMAKQLLQLPNELLLANDEIVSQRLADFDYYLKIETEQGVKTWVLDGVNEGTSTEIKKYIDLLIEINGQLKD